MIEEILKVKEVCAMLGISRTTLYRLVKTGQIEAFYINKETKIRKHPRFHMTAVQEYMQKNKIT